MKKYNQLFLLVSCLVFAFSSDMVAQEKVRTVELTNYSKLRLDKPTALATAKSTKGALSAKVQDGKVIIKKGFILCGIRNSNLNLPNFMILPERLVQRTSKIDISKLLSEAGLHGIRLNPGPLSVLTCIQCSDTSSTECTVASEKRDDGKTNVYCSGCCNTRSVAQGSSLAIPEYIAL